MKKLMLTALKLIVAIVLIWALINFGVLDLSALRGVAGHPGGLITVVCVLVSTYFLAACRWYVLLKSQSVDITFNSAIRISFFTFFFGTFLPGGHVGGDAVRIAYVAKRLSSKRTAAVLSIFLDRLLGLYAIMLVACSVAFLDPTDFAFGTHLDLLATTAGLICAAIPLIGYALYASLNSRNRRFNRIVRILPSGFVTDVFYKLIESLKLYRYAPGAIAIALGISVLAFILAIACVMILGSLMDLGSLTSIDYGIAASWASLANLVPITPGGLGVGEAAFDRICHWREAQQTTAAYGTIFLAFRLATVVATLPGLMVYLLSRDTLLRTNDIS